MLKNKWFVYLLMVFFTGTAIEAENSTFLLIDVSGNPLSDPVSKRITAQERQQAINIAESVISQNLDMDDYPGWTLLNPDGIVASAKSQSNRNILGRNDIFAVMPYGEKETYKKFKIFNANPSINLTQGFEYARSLVYRDQWTFGKIANAKTADIAIDANIRSYYLIEISGLGGDQTGSVRMSQEENQIINLYESSVIIKPLGLFQKTDKEYRVSVRKIEIKSTSSIGNTAGSKGIIQPENVQFQQLRLLSPIGSKNNPFTLKKDEELVVSWLSLGHEPGTNYTVVANNLTNKKREVKRCSNCNHLRMSLPAGRYSIQLSATGMPVAQNNNQIIRVRGSSGRTFLLLLFWSALIIGSVFYLKKKDPFSWFGNKREKKKIEDNNDGNININI